MIFSAQDFFLEKILTLRLPVHPHTNIYLASIFDRMVKTEHFFKNASADKAFSIQYLELSVLKDNQEEYQRLGDCLFFYTTYFKKKIDQDKMDIAFYYQLGSLAYAAALKRSSVQETALKEMTDGFSFLAKKTADIFLIES